MKVIWDQVEKYYLRKKQTVPALGPVSLTLEDGSFTAVIGPSGCGKTTLLNITGGLLPPDQGTVRFLPDATPPLIGMVFQQIGLLPWMTIRENIALGIHFLPEKERQERTLRWLNIMGLSDFSSAWPYQLSGGMQQRAGIARALAMEPDLLLMDEPFSALDAQTRKLLSEELLNLWESVHATTLYITHNIEEAVYLADRIIVMSRRPGRIIGDLTVDAPRRDRMLADWPIASAGLKEKIWKLLKIEAAAAMKGDSQ